MSFVAMQCTKILVSGMHGGLLGLDKEYSIHVEDIQQLTGLSIVGDAVSIAFQTGQSEPRKMCIMIITPSITPSMVARVKK